MLTILVAEDEDKVRGILAQFLTLRGYSVSEAQNGQEAVAAGTDHCFDVVFMDVKMPKMDGLKASREIRIRCPDTEIVLMTGYAIDARIDQALQDGTAACLKRKPFTLDEITGVLEQIESKKTGELPKTDDDSCCGSSN